jgi:hypothetical protein
LDGPFFVKGPLDSLREILVTAYAEPLSEFWHVRPILDRLAQRHLHRVEWRIR